MDSSKKTTTTQAPEGTPASSLSASTIAALQAHQANPGPVIKDDFDVQEEGTKQERLAKAKELNKEDE
ncbi:hypothetical protein QBC42DRAFT_276668 [Cladorrhinum samala]|uniref:Uncharacterized protein n=1 Tax=Cladorrhinum samala TaxID=585594 RepID=A0AAV9HCF3_9PEZI|nr:hypothetical protein QBC42DRAFT_276668 [Cladorrhinum samala]